MSNWGNTLSNTMIKCRAVGMIKNVPHWLPRINHSSKIHLTCTSPAVDVGNFLFCVLDLKTLGWNSSAVPRRHSLILWFNCLMYMYLSLGGVQSRLFLIFCSHLQGTSGREESQPCWYHAHLMPATFDSCLTFFCTIYSLRRGSADILALDNWVSVMMITKYFQLPTSGPATTVSSCTVVTTQPQLLTSKKAATKALGLKRLPLHQERHGEYRNIETHLVSVWLKSR